MIHSFLSSRIPGIFPVMIAATCLFLGGCVAASPSIAQSWSSGGPLSERQQGFDIDYYEIDIEIFPDDRLIANMVTAHVKALKDGVREIELDLVRMYEVHEVRTESGELDFSHQDDKLVITLTDILSLVHTIPIQIRYSGNPPVAERPPWEGGFTWDEDSRGNHWVSVSCQLEGGKMWLPVKDHPVSRPDSVAISVTVPGGYTAASNGMLRETVSHENGKITWHWKTRYPVHWYNINVTMGVFEEVSTTYRTEDGKDMPVVFYVLSEDAHKAPELLEITVDMLVQLRHYYGEYAFTKEKFGLVHTPYLGMEHQTINAYGNDFDYTVHDGRPYDWLLLHEMGHEWWGNSVTVRDWAEFWIHEGITTFTDALFLWDYYSPDIYYDKIMEYVGSIRNHQPVIPGTDITSAEVYNHDVYYKGAWFMHTLMHVMGRAVFLEALRSFAVENRYGYTDTESMKAHFQNYTSVALGPLFQLYLYDTALPDFQVRKLHDHTYEVRLTGLESEVPVQVKADGRTRTMMLSSEPALIESESVPVIDPKNWYLKASMFE